MSATIQYYCVAGDFYYTSHRMESITCEVDPQETVAAVATTVSRCLEDDKTFSVIIGKMNGVDYEDRYFSQVPLMEEYLMRDALQSFFASRSFPANEITIMIEAVEKGSPLSKEGTESAIAHIVSKKAVLKTTMAVYVPLPTVDIIASYFSAFGKSLPFSK